MYFTGIIIAISTFLVIGIFHPIVIKVEYHTGTRYWWLFLLLGIACIVAQEFHVPVLFAKKNKTINIANDVYTSKVESFTHKRTYDIIVSKDFLKPEDKVLIIDDFLAMGSALKGLISLIRDAGATIVGAGIIIEKAYQQGGEMIRDMGVRVESLARIKSMDNNVIEFI